LKPCSKLVVLAGEVNTYGRRNIALKLSCGVSPYQGRLPNAIVAENDHLEAKNVAGWTWGCLRYLNYPLYPISDIITVARYYFRIVLQAHSLRNYTKTRSLVNDAEALSAMTPFAKKLGVFTDDSSLPAVKTVF
jgi:hypothetical protein